jgi:hypothetical protein
VGEASEAPGRDDHADADNPQQNGKQHHGETVALVKLRGDVRTHAAVPLVSFTTV